MFRCRNARESFAGTELLVMEDAARLVGLAQNSLAYATYRGRLPYFRLGATKLFTREDLLEFERRRRKPQR